MLNLLLMGVMDGLTAILSLSAADPQLTKELATLDPINVIVTLLQRYSRFLTSNISVAPAALLSRST